MANHSLSIWWIETFFQKWKKKWWKIPVHSLSHPFQNLDSIARSFDATVEPIDGVVRYKRARWQTLGFGQETDTGCRMSHRFENFNQRRRWTYFGFGQERFFMVFGGNDETIYFWIQWERCRFGSLCNFSRTIQNFAARSMNGKWEKVIFISI